MAGRKRFSWDDTGAQSGGGSSSKKLKADISDVLELSVLDLKPGMIRDQSLKIRVTYAAKEFLSQDGSKWVHNFNAIGKDGNEISFVSFGDTAKQLGQRITENKIYSVTTFEVKTSHPNHQKCQNPLEIHLKPFSEVTEQEDSDSFPPIFFDCIALGKALEKPDGDTVDFMAVVVEDLGLEEMRNSKKRELVLTDKDKTLVSFVLWGNIAEKWSVVEFPIVSVRKAMVSSYLGVKNLQYSSRSGTYVKVNPSTDEATDLRDWFNAENQKRLEAQSSE